MGNDLGPVLLTGASGYLGRHVLARINARGLPCVPTSLGGAIGEPCDLRDPSSVRGLLKRTSPSVLIHCAAIVPKRVQEYADTAAADASVAMLKTVADHAPCPIVLASSMTLYDGAPSDGPVDEGWDQVPPPGYARGKWTAEQVLCDWTRPGDVALRLPGLFGLPRRSGVLYHAAKAFLTDGRFELAPTAGPWAAMAVGDAAEYLVRAATTRSDDAARAVNVGYEGEFSVVSAVAQIARACGVEWHSSSPPATPFSMRLERLYSLYGRLGVTFGQRLGDFVEDVRDYELV